MFVYYILAGILVYFSFRSFREGLAYLDFFRRESNRERSSYAPFATIIAPCKGLDSGLEANLDSLFNQDYPAWEILFVTGSENDESTLLIRQLLKKYREGLPPARLIFAGEAFEESQKVHNLREAIRQASPESGVFAFVDSDARPGKDWLASLIGPLEDKQIGAATGYRWFIGANGGFATALRSAWNASIASQLGKNLSANFCWGGSMAIRRDTFDSLCISEKWKGTLSDDFVATKAIRDAGLGIYFVPKCLTPSIENCTFLEMLEFTTRQMKITRVYAPKFWILSFIGSGLFCSVMLASILIIAFGAAFWFPLAAILLVSLFSAMKAWLRLKAAKAVLKEYQSELDRQLLPHIALWPISSLLFFYNSFAALLSRQIVWRGIRYELQSSSKTAIKS